MVQYKYLVSRPFSKGVGSGEQGIEKKSWYLYPVELTVIISNKVNELLAKPSSSFRLKVHEF